MSSGILLHAADYSDNRAEGKYPHQYKGKLSFGCILPLQRSDGPFKDERQGFQ